MILDRNAEIERTIFIGNPISILFQKSYNILFNEFANISCICINKEIIEEFIKSSKKRIKKELDREITMIIPFLEKATEEDWVSIRKDFALNWLEGSIFQLEEKPEDKEIQELFRTFPIGDTLLV